MSAKLPSAQPPAQWENLVLTEPKENAAGVAGVVTALRHVHNEIGLRRGLGALSKMNQTGGFDCPGCAWPDPEHERSTLGEYCENGAKALAEEATTKRVTSTFFLRHSLTELAQQSDHWLGKQGRLIEPMVLRQGHDHYTPISWEEAFAKIAGHLNALESPHQALFYTSGRTSNEAAFLYQLFVRLFGTNNLPDCSNMCHESSGTGLKETIGVGKGTVTLDDFQHAGTIVVIGQNPGTNHPRMLSTLQEAKRHGARILSINPLNEAGLKRFQHPQEVRGVLGGTQLADQFLQVRINGDVALLKGFAKEMLAREDAQPGSVLDHAFVREHTLDFEAFAHDIRETSWASITESSGISYPEIQQAVDILTRTRRTIFCWAMGLTQHQNGVANVQMCTNLLLMQGAIGKKGAGACPVRGHSNVQGDRTMGIWERPPADFLDRLGQAIGFEPPREHGHDTVASIQAMLDHKAHVFFALGGNFLSATPDTTRTAQALRNCRLTVHVSTKLNRSHLITGSEALILPCLARSERDIQDGKPQFVTVENSMGVVHSSQGDLPPASEDLLSEPVIVARLAQATLGEKAHLPWLDLVRDYDAIRDLIERSIAGFSDYNRRVRQPNGFYLPNPARDGHFDTPTQKALFKVHPIPKHDLSPDQWMMMTIRSHDQYNTTIYGLDDRYRGIYNARRVALIHPLDLKEAGFKARQVVDITSEYEGEIRKAIRFRLIPYPIPRRCLATYFPEANVLVPLHYKAEGSHTPASKSIPVRLHPTAHPTPHDHDFVEES